MAVPARQRVPRRRTTPEILRGLIFLLWAADVVVLLASIAGANVHRGTLQTVGRDSAPSIVAAQRIKAALAHMDAQAANTFLLPSAPDELRLRAYEASRQEAAGALISAAENITYGDSERQPIRTLQLGLGDYEALIARARDLYTRHDPGFLAAYKEAAAVMDSTLLPAADNLDEANQTVLESVYGAHGTRSVVARGFVLLTALLFLYALLSVQTFLSRRMNRTLNLPLLAATLLTLGWVGWITATLTGENRLLKAAKEDAFASIHALCRARAAAYSANAHVSRYRLDKAERGRHEANFRFLVSSIAKAGEGREIAEVAHAASMSRETPGFSGALANVLHNIRFPGERDATVSTLLHFGEYLQLESEIGAHEDAATQAFDRFDQSLGKTLAINQAAFDGAVNDAFAELNGFEWKSSVAAVVIALLVLGGLMQRMAEYR